MSSKVGRETGDLHEQQTRAATDREASRAVVDAVAEAAGTTPTELPTLNDVVDPDALDALFSGDRMDGEVSFPYADYRVTVTADRRVTVVSPAE